MHSELATRRNATHLAPIKTASSERALPDLNQEPIRAQSNSESKALALLEKRQDLQLDVPPQKASSKLLDKSQKSSLLRADHSMRHLLNDPDAQWNKPSQVAAVGKTLRPKTEAGSVHNSNASESRPRLKTARSFRNLRPAKNKDEPTHSHLRTHWHPPPLFQAYPQAIKHASLEDPSSSAASYPLESGESASSGMGKPSASDGTVRRGRLLERIKSRGRLKDDYDKSRGANSSDRSWCRKVFVLVTSGYLLQYDGDGAFDRMPEKILKLGADSAAFASDALEGKHWVLEVFQNAKADDYTIHATNKGFLSRIGLQGPTRKMASKLLLVFPSADEMDSWMVAIRKEIGLDDDKLTPKIKLPPLKRYSSIIRDPSIASRTSQAKFGTESCGSSPTLVAPSLRNSGSTVVASESSFQSRKTRQLSPTYNNADAKTMSTLFSPSDPAVIGPALMSPGFFERHYTPQITEFSKEIFQDRYPRTTLGSNDKPKRLSHRISLNSFSPQSASRSDTEENNHDRPTLTQARSTPDLNQHYLSPTYLQVPAESDTSTPSTPSLQSFPEPPCKVTLTVGKEMDSIAESPPRTNPRESLHNDITAAKRSAGSLCTTKQLNSALVSNSHITNEKYDENGRIFAKRTSVFARPLPIATTDTRIGTWLDPASGRTSVRVTPPVSPQLWRSTSNRSSTKSQPGSPSFQQLTHRHSNATGFQSRQSSGKLTQQGNTPPPTSPSFNLSENPLRRPASLQIRSDPTPFLSAARQTHETSSVNTLPKLSEQPPTRHHISSASLRSKASEKAHSSISTLYLPPPKPPPNIPLPLPPTTIV